MKEDSRKEGCRVSGSVDEMQCNIEVAARRGGKRWRLQPSKLDVANE